MKISRLKTGKFNEFICIIWLPVVLVLSLFLHGELGAVLYRSFSSKNISYICLDESIFGILFQCFIILDFIVLAFYFQKMLGKDSSFDSRSISSNVNSKRITKNCISICCCIYVFAMVFFALSVHSRVEADSQGFKQYNLFEDDIVIFEYDDAESVDVYLQYVYKGKFNSGYETVIDVKVNDNVYTLTFNGFSGDYFNIQKFLSNFQDDKIIVDKSFSDKTDEIEGYYEQSECFKKIYK